MSLIKQINVRGVATLEVVVVYYSCVTALSAPKPRGVALSAGTWVPDEAFDLGGYVLVCGGWACPAEEGGADDDCGQTADCYSWDPAGEADGTGWALHSALTTPRIRDIMVMVGKEA